jgi:hypothetical protein
LSKNLFQRYLPPDTFFKRNEGFGTLNASYTLNLLVLNIYQDILNSESAWRIHQGPLRETLIGRCEKPKKKAILIVCQPIVIAGS